MKAYNLQNGPKEYATLDDFLEDYEMPMWMTTDSGMVDVIEEDRVFLFNFIHYESHDSDVQVAVLKEDLSGEDIYKLRNAIKPVRRGTS